MISIFILYHNERIDELISTIFCLQEMDKYKDCQKILCCDGKTNINPYEFETLEIIRKNNFYCWAKCWEESISICKFDNILYMDSDRILPKNYLIEITNNLKNNMFIFPQKLYKLKNKVPISLIRNIRDNIKNYNHMLEPDFRIINPYKAIDKKNPMSGCVAFTKKSFIDSGGLDFSFCGYGYPDTDYFMKTYKMGYEFKSIDCNEIHLKHDYGKDNKFVKLSNFWNKVKFFKKWNIPIDNNIKIRAKQLNVNFSILDNFENLEDFIKFHNNKITKIL